MTNGPSELPDDFANTQELFEGVFQAVPGGIVLVGVAGNILKANPEALRILGLSWDTLSQRYITNFERETIHEDGSPCPPEEYPVAIALRTGKPSGPTTIGVRTAGSQTSWAVFRAVPLHNADGSTKGAVVTFLDISPRKRIEQALRESEAHLRSLFDSAPNMIMTVERDGTILFMNRTVPSLDVQQVVGQNMFEFCEPKTIPVIQSCLERVFESGKNDGYEVPGNPAIDPSWYRVSAGPVIVGGKVVAVTLVLWDITAQKELETRLMIADRLASVGTLVAGVAHEINNPLTYIMGNLQRIQLERQRLQSIANLDLCIENALDGVERIRHVVSDLSTFSTSTQQSLRPTNLRTILESSLRIAHNEIQHRARLLCDYEDVPPVFVDASRLGQVFLNLLINAAQAIAPGHPTDNQIAIVVRNDENERVLVSISDTGHGIPEELVARIFDPFVTTKPAGTGTGLGLYICHNIVKSLHGELWVKSVPNKETTFFVSLPTKPSPASSLSNNTCLRQRALLHFPKKHSVSSFMHAVVNAPGSGLIKLTILLASRRNTVERKKGNQ
jgi:two-component system, NtrC family, sensor kinase